MVKIWNRRDTAGCGTCFNAVFGIPFGRIALRNFRTLMASWTSSGRGNWGHWQVSESKTSAPRQTSQYPPGPKCWPPTETNSPDSQQGKSTFSESERAISPGWPEEDGVETLITRLVILQGDWSSEPRVRSVALHWGLIHSLNRRVTDIWRRLTSALRVGSVVTWQCLHSRFFRQISTWMPACIGGRGSARGRRLGVDAARALRPATEKFSTYVLIAIPSCNFGSNGIWSSKWVWKLVQLVRLKSGRSGGSWKDERHVVSMNTGRRSELSADEVGYTSKYVSCL